MFSETTIDYKPPVAWATDNRKRHFILLPERHYAYETDMDALRRSVQLFLKQQDQRGSFYTDTEFGKGDKVDDQLGAASALAFWMARNGPDEQIAAALERSVRFHLDHLVWPASPTRPFRYSRDRPDRESTGDWCGTNWCLWGGSSVLLHGAPFLSDKTAAELRDVLVDNWRFLTAFPTRDENPCHNQLLAYCDIGALLSRAVGDKAIVQDVLDYYHQRLRRLRILDRGHWIYTEFNQWDANYGLLSWMALEHLFAMTGDPVVGEDAEQMALYFNELVSAGGYIWGGSRREEGGMDEFIHVPARWATELGLDRLLLPEPSHLWRQFTFDGHYIKALVHRMDIALPQRQASRSLSPTPWHFRAGPSSACLSDDRKIHQVSSNGLEIIPAANTHGIGSGLIWESSGDWKCDYLHANPPKASEGHPYVSATPVQMPGLIGLSTMQRGYLWETRQWWISCGQGNLLWVCQLITHSSPRSDKLHFLLGNPILTRLAEQPVPVTEVASAEGACADTQGDAATVASEKFLRFGDNFVGGTAPLNFVRPAKDAFHTFPAPGGRNLRDCPCSNELRVVLSDKPMQPDCRESFFFAVELGPEVPALAASRDSLTWKLRSRPGLFEAIQVNDIWRYTFTTSSGPRQLPQMGFGYQS